MEVREGGRCRCWPLTEPADLRGLARRRSLRGDEDSAGTQQKIVVRPAPRRAVAARTQWVGLLPRTGAEAPMLCLGCGSWNTILLLSYFILERKLNRMGLNNVPQSAN